MLLYAAAAATALTFPHAGQAGLHLQPGLGYRVLFPYNSEFCGQAQKSVCSERSPAFVELGLSYALSSTVELIGDLRLGVESDFGAPGSDADAPRALAFAPGARFYLDDEGALKFFMTLQGVFDLTDFSGAAGVDDGMDLAVRNVNGILLDLNRHYGVYLHFGESIGFLRWLRFEMDAGLGVQVRLP